MKSFGVEWYHQVPSHVKEILRVLHENGHTAFIVGGAVRDLWLGLTPKDFDIASSAAVEQIEALFPETLAVGKQFGIMVVVTPEGPVEIARFRTDGEYTDNRHPSEVKFTNPEEDAKRRDFTINALFYDAAKEAVLDYVGGVPDLERRRLRTVGYAEDRFAEDALRMLRAFRFYAQVPHSTLDDGILHAVDKNHDRICDVSKERVTQEFLKLLDGPQCAQALPALAITPLYQSLFSSRGWSARDISLFTKVIAVHCGYFGAPTRDLLLTFLTRTREPANLDILLLAKNQKEKLAAIGKLANDLEYYETIGLAAKKRLAADENFGPAWSLAFAENNQELGQTLLQSRAQWEKEGKLHPEPLLRAQDLIELGLKPGPLFKTLLEKVREAQLQETISSRADALVFLEKISPREPRL